MECSYCYNTGKTESQQHSAGILACHYTHSGAVLPKFEKLYYLNTSAAYIIGNSSDTTGILEEGDMKNNVLFNNLNNGKWLQVTNDYPILKWQQKD